MNPLRTILWTTLAIFGTCCWLVSGAAAQERTPVNDKAIRLELLPPEEGQRLGQNGYQLYLNRLAAETLRDILHDNVNEREIAKAFADRSDDLKVKVLAHVVAARVTLFKKELADKIGPGGVLITVKGPKPQDLLKKDQTQEDRNRADRRDALIQTVLPRKLRPLQNVINTVPTHVTVEPREADGGELRERSGLLQRLLRSRSR